MYLAFVEHSRAPLSLTQDDYSLEAITHLFATYEIGQKDGTAVIPAMFDPCPQACRNTGKRHGVECTGGVLHRLGENVTHMTMLGLDFDQGTQAEFSEFLSSLDRKGLRYWFWHTHSYIAPAPKPGLLDVCKARVMIPFSEPLAIPSPAYWRQVARPALLRHVGAEIKADMATSDPSRLFYLPRKPNDRCGHQAGYHDGEPLVTAGIVDSAITERLAAGADVPIPQYVDEDPERPVDLDALRTRLGTITKSPATPIVRRLLRGEALTEPPDRRMPGAPSRYEAWRSATGILAEIAEMWMASSALLQLLEPSWRNEVKDSPNDYTEWDTIEHLLATARSGQPERRARAEAQRAIITQRNVMMARAGARKAREETQTTALAEHPPEDEDAPEGQPEALAKEFNDMDNTALMARLYGNTLRWVDEFRKWLAWDASRWVLTDRDEGLRCAMLAQAHMREELADLEESGELPDDALKARRAWVRKSGNMPMLESMVKGFRSKHTVSVAALDTDPWLFNVQNGTIDLRLGEMVEAQREWLMTKCAGVAYDDTATCPTWRRFVEQIQPDPEVRLYLQKAVGHALTGDVSEQVLFFCHGTGSNGKSTFFRAIQEMMGDYSVTAVSKLLLRRHHDAHTTEQMDLMGSRLALCSEVSDKAVFSAETLKQLTGGDIINARRMGQDATQFKPTHKLFMCSNPKPRVDETDEGTWRRMRLIPFTASFTGAQQDTQLIDKLRAELPGILNWAIEGCLRWQIEGLQPPEAVRHATREYREEEDSMRSFIEDKLTQGGEVTHKALYRIYVEWCRVHEGDAPVMIPRQLAKVLRARGFEGVRKNDGLTWVNYSVKATGMRPLRVVEPQKGIQSAPYIGTKPGVLQ